MKIFQKVMKTNKNRESHEKMSKSHENDKKRESHDKISKIHEN